MKNKPVCPLCFGVKRSCDHASICIVTDCNNVILHRLKIQHFEHLKEYVSIGTITYFPFIGDYKNLKDGEVLSDDMIKNQYESDIYTYYDVERVLLTGRRR